MHRLAFFLIIYKKGKEHLQALKLMQLTVVWQINVRRLRGIQCGINTFAGNVTYMWRSDLRVRTHYHLPYAIHWLQTKYFELKAAKYPQSFTFQFWRNNDQFLGGRFPSKAMVTKVLRLHCPRECKHQICQQISPFYEKERKGVLAGKKV